MNREENQDFESLSRNHINITCHCRESGYEWSSRFGICVDVNECACDLHDCNLENGQICINQPGSYTCICGVGFAYKSEKKSCVKNPIVEKALQPAEDKEARPKPKIASAFESLVKALTRSSAIGKTRNDVFLQNILIPFVILLPSL